LIPELLKAALNLKVATLHPKSLLSSTDYLLVSSFHL